MPANFVRTPDGEKAWKKAKGIVAKEYGAGLEKSDPDKFYSLVTTIYKNVCKSPDFDCWISKAEAAEPGTMGVLIEEKITQEWIKGVRKWWLQWKKGEKKALPDMDYYDRKHICDAYKFLAEGITRIRRLRDNLLYVQGFWPYKGSGKKTKDHKEYGGQYAMMNTDGTVQAYDLRNFQARLIYKIDDVENMIWGIADYMSKGCNDFEKITAEDGQSFWRALFQRTRDKVKRVDRVLLDEIFNQLKKIEKEILLPMKKAQDSLNKDGVKLSGFYEALPEAKIGKVTLVLDTLPIEMNPANAKKGGQDVQRSPKQLHQYVKEAIRTQKLLNKKGFGKLWYGVIVVKGRSKGQRKIGKDAAKSWLGGQTGKTWQASAAYLPGADKIHIYSKPKDFMYAGVGAKDLLHEMAHRYWARFMSGAQRRQWARNFKKAEFSTDYASRNAEEEFAENFAFYVLGRLKGPHVDRLRSAIRESVGPENELEILAENLAVFCEGVSSKKLREAEQMMGWHEQDAIYLRKQAKNKNGVDAEMALEAAESHEKAAESFRVAIHSQSAKDLKKAKNARKLALVATRKL